MCTVLDLLKDTLATALENYKDNARVLSAFDDKAQKMGAIAGLFLAVPFAFAKPADMRTLSTTVGTFGMRTLLVAIASFMACIVLCLAAMWVGTIDAPLDLETSRRLVEDLVPLLPGRPEDQRIENHFRDKLNIWQECITSQRKIIDRKSLYTILAQVVLSFGILSIAALLFHLILTVATG
jgi:hypothetical protein